jgi:sugar lactone lactonase YvrE
LRPGGITIDPSGIIYVSDTANNSIKKIAFDGTTTLFAGKDGSAGSTDGTGTVALFNGPTAITNDGVGNFYVADTGNATIRKITSLGVVTTLAGSAGNRGNADGVGTLATFSSPAGLDLDVTGNLYIADSVTSTIRKINLFPVVATTTAAAIPVNTVATFAGLPMSIGETDGVGSAARFNSPTGLSVDGDNIIYVADTNNNTIRRITSVAISTYASDGVTVTSTIPAASVTTLAGSPGISGSYDGTGSFALFSNPTGLSAPRATNSLIYIADTGNNLIRAISSRDVTTVAGIAGISGYRDGTSNTALFNQPKAVLAQGTSLNSARVYVADTGNSSVRVLYGNSATGINLKADTSTTTTTGTTTTTTSSGGGALECWFAGAILLLFIRAGRVRRSTCEEIVRPTSS